MSQVDELLPRARGSYVLWFYLPGARSIEVGRLGRLSFRRGWYGYCGSAFGPGGLRARLGHHLRPSLRRHWHVDYFKSYGSLREIWWSEGKNHEHELSRILSAVDDALIPVPGFGAADCRCPSHFVRLPRRALIRQLYRRIAGPLGLRRLNSPASEGSGT